MPIEAIERCDFDTLDVSRLPPRWRQLTQTIGGVVKSFSALSFTCLNVEDDETIFRIASMIDDVLQITEDMEVRDRDIDMGDGGGGGEDG
jgi:hypothetical protein